jgi:hypothetical protein
MKDREQKAERRRIKSEVKARVDSGEPKQLILDEMSQLYKDKLYIVRLLESMPSVIMKYRYRMFNYLLAAMLTTSLLLDAVTVHRMDWGRYPVIDVNSALNIAMDAVFLCGILMYRIETYGWIAARAVISIITIAVSYIHYHHAVDIIVFVSLALILVSFVFGLMLGIRLCPPRVPKIVEIDLGILEKKISKTIYVFPD